MDELMAVIKLFGGNFAPRNFALCEGQILSIAQNTALFSLLGTTYGGNGQTTFGLPDLRGRVPIGQGQSTGFSPIYLGEVGGSQNSTLLNSNLPAHNHIMNNIKVSNNVGDSADPRGKVLAQGAKIGSGPNAINLKQYVTYDSSNTNNNGNLGAPLDNTAQTGGGQPFNIMQPYLGINFIICTAGIFPPRPW